MNIIALFIISQMLVSSPFAIAQQLRGVIPANDELIAEEDHRDLATSTCPSRVSYIYQQDSTVTPCTKNSDCVAWSTPDLPGCCLYPLCICGVNHPGASAVTCVNDAVSTTTPSPTVRSTPKPSARPTPKPPVKLPTIRPTIKPTVRTTPKPTVRTTPKPTVRTTPKPTVKLPTVRPTIKPTVRTTPKPSVKLPTVRPTIKPTVRVPTLKPTIRPTTKNTCPSKVSGFYQGVTGASTVIPCKQNSDCARWTQDGSGCCLYPYCICGAKNVGSSGVTCLSF